MTSVIKEAATVVLVRQEESGLEVFMLERPARGIFPELHVFPGGKVDTEDESIASQYGQVFERTRWGIGCPTKFAVTVIRECFEEAGVLFVEAESCGSDAVGVIDGQRESLLSSDQTFAELLNNGNLKLDFSNLFYFSHWITPARAPARFNTRFFVACIPEQQSASHHISETESGAWVSPSTALENYSAGKWQMIWPTLTTLRMISGYASVERLIKDVEVGRHRIPITPSMHAQGMQYFELS